jgi:hypothetical protein
VRRGFLSLGFLFRALRRLKHPAILRKIDSRAQNFFLGSVAKVDRALRRSVLKSGGEVALNYQRARDCTFHLSRGEAGLALGVTVFRERELTLR